MADIQTLGIKVQTDGVKQAKTQLDGLAVSGGKAEKSTESLTREIKQQDRAARATSRSVGGLVGALGILAGSVVISRTISTIIRNTVEQDRVTAQLNATLRSTGRLTPELSQGLQSYAQSLQNVTTFGDEAIVSAQSLLLTFAQIGGDEFLRANKVVLDLSTALGVDLKEASIQVGKALNDPVLGVSALARSGIQFSLSQKQLIKDLVETNKVAEAQKIILAELEFQFGGSAEAARNTLGGAIEGLKNAFGDLLEGDSGGEGVKGTVTALNQLTSILQSPSLKQSLQDIVQLVIAGVGAFADLAVGITEVSKRFGLIDRGPLESAIDAEQQYLVLLDEIDQKIADKQSLNPLRQARGLLFGGGSINELEEERAQIAENLEAAKGAIRDLAREQAKRDRDALTGVAGPNVPAIIAPGGGGNSKKAAAAARAEAAARRKLAAEEEALARKLEQADLKRAAANEQFVSGLEDVEALLAGPLAQAELQHIRNLEEIQRVGTEAGVSQDLINRAKEGEIERYQRENAEIAKREDVAGRLIEDLEFELSLIGLSNTEREKAILLRQLEGKATEEQTAAIGGLLDALKEEQEAQQQADRFRDSFKDSFKSFIDGSKSAKDAFSDFIDSITDQIAELLAQQATAALFGQQGTTGGGSTGGIFSSLLGSLFGGGSAKGNAFSGGNVLAFAKGGVVDRTTPFGMSGGRFGVMGESGPEAILPLHRGRDGKLGVKAANDADGGQRKQLPNLQSNLTINVQGRVDRRTVDQLAVENSRRLRVAARNA